jgi:hypothetical protein
VLAAFSEAAQQLIQNIQNIQEGIGDDTNMMDWVERNRFIFGQPFSYTYADIAMMIGKRDKKLDKAPRPYFNQYANDRVADKTVLKCRQSELSESEINENLWLCATRPYTNVRHIFPTNGMATRIAKEKISPAAENSPKIRTLLQAPLNQQSKAFRNGSFYTVDSSWTDYQGRGPSSDKLTFDEYESMNPKIEDIFSESTSHSAIGRKVRISTPLAPGGGIDEKFLDGCMYRWVVTCPRCKTEQVMEFPDNLIGGFEKGNLDTDSEQYRDRLDKCYIGCSHCGQYFDRTSKWYLETSQWRAQKPGLIGVRHSYHISYFMLAWKTGKEILYKYHTFTYINQFRNEVLGIADVGETARLGKDMIEACIDPSFVKVMKRIGMLRCVSVGVDWGLTSWVVVMANGIPGTDGRPYIIYMERIDKQSLKKGGYSVDDPMAPAKRVKDIANLFRAAIVINDANGIGTDRNSFLIREFPGRAWGCFYDTEEIQRQKMRVKTIEPRWQPQQSKVTVSRVGTLKGLLQMFRDRLICLPRKDLDVEELIKHIGHLAVLRQEDPKTLAEYEIVTKTGPDHFAHSANYAKIGFDQISGQAYGKVAPGVISGEMAPNAAVSTPPMIDNMPPAGVI